MIDTSNKPEFSLDAALIDCARLAAQDMARSGDSTMTEDLYGSAALPVERMTYPTARNKSGDFICGCTVTTAPVETDPVEADPIPAGPVTAPELRSVPGSTPLQHRISRPTRINGLSQIATIRSNHRLGN